VDLSSGTAKTLRTAGRRRGNIGRKMRDSITLEIMKLTITKVAATGRARLMKAGVAAIRPPYTASPEGTARRTIQK
jgi:hypothetical protein